MAIHNILGAKGEQLATGWLKEKGYLILDRNWRYLRAEIDIIAQKDETLAIVEVKTRSSVSVVRPEDAINKKKIKLLIEAANQYVIQNDLDVEVRFDIVTVLKKNNSFVISHTKDAFYFFT